MVHETQADILRFQQLKNLPQTACAWSAVDIWPHVLPATRTSASVHGFVPCSLGEYALHDLSDDLKQLSSQRPSLDLAVRLEQSKESMISTLRGNTSLPWQLIKLPSGRVVHSVNCPIHCHVP